MPALSCLGILGIQAWVNGFRLVGCKAGNGHVERMVARVGKECLHLRHHRHKQRPMCATAYWLRHDACCSATRLCAAAVLLPAAACVRRPGCLHAATARRCQSTNGCSEQHLTRATFYIIPVPLFLLPCPLPHAAAAARFVAPISFFAAGVPLHACMHLMAWTLPCVLSHTCLGVGMPGRAGTRSAVLAGSLARMLSRLRLQLRTAPLRPPVQGCGGGTRMAEWHGPLRRTRGGVCLQTGCCTLALSKSNACMTIWQCAFKCM